MILDAILVEDEARSREILRNYITKYCPNVNLVGEASGVDEAVELIRNQQLDLVFLDVEMPYGNAFDLLEKVGDRTFETVFVTAYDHYAKDALNAHASYYLLKPINIDELIKAVDYVVAIKSKETQLKDKVLSANLKSVDGKITIPTQEGFEVLQVNEIVYCEADNNYTTIYLKDDKKVVSKTLKYFEDALTDFGFARIHKSYLVNVNAITKYIKGKGGQVELNSEKVISVSASKKADLLNYFS
jgi:two-component system LytT family response regulator